MPRDVLSDVAVLCALALSLALLIERFFEVVKAALDLLDSRYDLHRLWTRRAERLRHLLERRLRAFRYLTPEQLQVGLTRMYDVLLHTPGSAQGGVPTISGDLVRAGVFRLIAKVGGMLIGIVLAWQLHIDLFVLWPSATGAGVPLPPVMSETVRLVLTGAAIGLGAGPLHKIITTLERWRASRTAGGAA
jgi:hypothetical protein